MAYKNMNIVFYVALTTVYYLLCVLFSIVADSNIGPILSVISAYSITACAFYVPAMFYTKALNKFRLIEKDSE